MAFWIVRAIWDKVDNKMQEFVENIIWENAYPEEYGNIVNNVKVDDYLLLTDGSYVKYYAKCSKNIKNGEILNVQKWNLLNEPIYIPAKGNYIKTISQLNAKLYKDRIINEIGQSNQNTLYIQSLKTKYFMSLPNQNIEFCNGINIFIGENGTGKSQIIKLLYSVLDANNKIALDKEEADYEKQRELASSLSEVFKVGLGSLVKKSKKECEVNVVCNNYDFKFKFGALSKKEVQKADTPFKKQFTSKKNIFIPAKEVLSFYSGFRLLYEQKRLNFDKTYYNLCKALEEPQSKGKNISSEIIEKLGNILGGKISIIDGEFYLIKNDTKYEINIIAEGLRKIGLLFYLLKNSSLDNESILFWDEPEANMNPKLIDDIVQFLVILSNKGMQIFITTHSPFIIESFNNHLKKHKIQDKKTDDTDIENIVPLAPKDITAYLLEDNNITSILNKKYGLLDDKFLEQFNNINKIYDKMRDIEWDNK